MFSLSLPLAEVVMIWYALPLIVVISLVYSATRHEATSSIISHAIRLGVMIAGFMLVIMAILAVLAWWL